MKRLLTIFIALIFLAGIAGVSLAQDTSTVKKDTATTTTVKKHKAKTNPTSKSTKKIKKAKSKKDPSATAVAPKATGN